MIPTYPGAIRVYSLNKLKTYAKERCLARATVKQASYIFKAITDGSEKTMTTE
tara:strand:- start:584 stop:742 length:159 start_codon:yes stop_codon:yes gene_type:complete